MTGTRITAVMTGDGTAATEAMAGAAATTWAVATGRAAPTVGEAWHLSGLMVRSQSRRAARMETGLHGEA